MYIVAHNLLAMNAQRQFGINTKSKAKSMEKLSSGYKVNRAADDAAGLSISEKIRRQIRGLEQGAENIQDGISMIQVADGAMGEIFDMLHRLNELSVKAYNGTNTEEDRQYIQEEVDQILSEIGRIGETTTFNEIPVFQGNPKEIVKIEEDMEYTFETTYSVVKDLPAWLSVDDKLEVHQDYVGIQDTSGIMYEATVNSDDTIDYTYRGPNLGSPYGEYNAQWIQNSEWSPEIDNNPSAKISFKGLADKTDALDLYNGLFGLIGCSIGVPCGTCTDYYYGINFTGDEQGYSAMATGYLGNNNLAQGELNLSEWKGFKDSAGNDVSCFEAVLDLVQKQKEDLNLSNAEKAAQTKTLAEEIAGKLRDKSLDVMQNVADINDHFDRALSSDNYDIIVYDYRDDYALTNKHAADAKVQTTAKALVTAKASYVEPGEKVECERPIYVVCSSQSNDKIPLDLPVINLNSLYLEGYNVARYTEKVEYIGEDYTKKLKAWEEDYTYVTTMVTEKYKTEKIIKPEVTGEIFVNGERKKVVLQEAEIQYEEKTRTVPKTDKVYNSPKPEPKPGEYIKTREYDPSSNSLIKDALYYISMERSELGATQNRLEHAYNNNGNKHENLSAAESRIRDTDMAAEMVVLSKNNILIQAGQAMMAQANQSNQGVLSLIS